MVLGYAAVSHQHPGFKSSSQTLASHKSGSLMLLYKEGNYGNSISIVQTECPGNTCRNATKPSWPMLVPCEITVDFLCTFFGLFSRNLMVFGVFGG